MAAKEKHVSSNAFVGSSPQMVIDTNITGFKVGKTPCVTRPHEARSPTTTLIQKQTKCTASHQT